MPRPCLTASVRAISPRAWCGVIDPRVAMPGRVGEGICRAAQTLEKVVDASTRRVAH